MFFLTALVCHLTVPPHPFLKSQTRQTYQVPKLAHAAKNPIVFETSWGSQKLHQNVGHGFELNKSYYTCYTQNQTPVLVTN